MKKNIFLEAYNINRKIESAENCLKLIEYTNSMDAPPSFRIQGSMNGELIEDTELNHKIELLVISELKIKIGELKKQFESL